MNGKEKDVLIEDVFYYEKETGLKTIYEDRFTVWADEKMKEVIESVEGIMGVYNSIAKTQFTVYFDKRYNRDFLKKEIEAAILCSE